MTHSWVADVLSDLKKYAAMNDLHGLEHALEAPLAVAFYELGVTGDTSQHIAINGVKDRKHSSSL